MILEAVKQRKEAEARLNKAKTFLSQFEAERDKAQHAAEIDALRAERDALRAALARREKAIV